MQPLSGSRNDVPGPFAARVLANVPQLPDAERRVLLRLEQRPRQSWRAHAQLARAGVRDRATLIILVGWAARQRELSDGRRQILELLAPGDIVGLQRREATVPSSSITALTPMKTVEAGELQTLIRDAPHGPLTAGVLACLAERDHFQEQSLVRLGRQTAYERLAHILLELDWRMRRRKLSTDGSFNLPLTQEALADALGLSVVHVNRTLQQMRRENVVEMTRGQVRLLNTAALTTSAEFIPPSFAQAD